LCEGDIADNEMALFGSGNTAADLSTDSLCLWLMELSVRMAGTS